MEDLTKKWKILLKMEDLTKKMEDPIISEKLIGRHQNAIRQVDVSQPQVVRGGCFPAPSSQR